MVSKGIALLLAAQLANMSPAFAQDATQGRAARPLITEPRNAASGFAVVGWMTYVDTASQLCANASATAAQRSRDALAQWQAHNMAYVEAAFAYMAQVERWLAIEHGEAARRQFREDRKREFTSAVRSAQTTWFPDAVPTEEGCIRFSESLASGSLGFDRHAEFFPILKELKAEAGSTTPTP